MDTFGYVVFAQSFLTAYFLKRDDGGNCGLQLTAGPAVYSKQLFNTLKVSGADLDQSSTVVFATCSVKSVEVKYCIDTVKVEILREFCTPAKLKTLSSMCFRKCFHNRGSNLGLPKDWISEAQDH